MATRGPALRRCVFAQVHLSSRSGVTAKMSVTSETNLPCLPTKHLRTYSTVREAQDGRFS